MEKKLYVLWHPDRKKFGLIVSPYIMECSNYDEIYCRHSKRLLEVDFKNVEEWNGFELREFNGEIGDKVEI